MFVKRMYLNCFMLFSLFLSLMLSCSESNIVIIDDPCGNGKIDINEECDGTNLMGLTCQTLGFQTGDLVCTDKCKLDKTNCKADTTTCPNGVIDTDKNEQCDGTNLNGKTCESLNYEGGTLSCTENCRFDVSNCTGTPCNERECEPDEQRCVNSKVEKCNNSGCAWEEVEPCLCGCSNDGTCVTPCCGDEYCDKPTESDCNCPNDCEPECGDGCCTGNESCSSCEEDCSGTCDPDETEPCGLCGTRSCSAACGWSECEGEGVCEPDFYDFCTTECGSQGMHFCSSQCQWEICIPPDETCDWADNDCDQVADDGIECDFYSEIYINSTGTAYYSSTFPDTVTGFFEEHTDIEKDNSSADSPYHFRIANNLNGYLQVCFNLASFSQINSVVATWEELGSQYSDNQSYAWSRLHVVGDSEVDINLHKAEPQWLEYYEDITQYMVIDEANSNCVYIYGSCDGNPCTALWLHYLGIYITGTITTQY